MNILKPFYLLSIFYYFYAAHAYGFDHSHKKFDNVLKKYLHQKSSQTLFDYRSLKNNSGSLVEYLNSLSAVKKSEYDQFTANEKLAFLINAYNAFTIKLIIDHYPVKSIKDIGSFLSSPWSKDIVPLFGKKMSLDDIEHETIRKQFKEARIHFAVNCASIGCPSLYKDVFQGAILDKQLHQVSVNFLKNSEKNKFDLSKEEVQISKIFKWYGKDFDKHEKSVLNFVAKTLNYSKEDTERLLKKDIDYLDYDWNLNEWKQ